MSYPGETSIDARVRAVNEEFGRRRSRLFMVFASIELPLLLLLALGIYGLELVDPDVGIWAFVGVAVLGGLVLSMSLMKLIREQTAAVAQAKGENPLF